MSEPRHYSTRRRMRYMEEIGLSTQIGAIVDELRVLRARTPLLDAAESFTALLQRIDEIKAEEPKSPG